MDLKEVERYVSTVIPHIERELQLLINPPKKRGRPKKEPVDLVSKNKEIIDLYNLYVEVLLLIAPYNFQSYNKYLELDEDHNSPTRAFYAHRKDHLAEVFESFNDMEIYDKYDLLLVSLPPRVGKTTTGIRFLSWIMGKYPDDTEMATSYSDNITSSFYIGAMEIVQSQRFKDVFPDAPIVSQNAKREEIWLRVAKRYPTITFVPIGGSMTGRCEAGKYLYCDDLVSGIEEALSLPRMEKLWQMYTVNCKQRKKDGCKEIHVATRWSVHDVITRLAIENEHNPRCKIINIPCYDENEESNFNFKGGFGTGYYKELEATLDSISFNALYKQEPVEREGLLYYKDDLKYYFDLPKERPDTIIAICDSKNLGTDFVASPIAYIYGEEVYIEDVVYNKGLPDVTRPLVARKWIEHNVVRADVELNNGGNYYAEDLQEMLRKQGSHTTIRIFFSGNNKQTKIITYSDFVKKQFIFKDPSKYSKNSEYAKFMKDLLSWTQMGKNKHDDAPDSIAMLAQLIQDIIGCSIKILDRRALRI